MKISGFMGEEVRECRLAGVWRGRGISPSTYHISGPHKVVTILRTDMLRQQKKLGQSCRCAECAVD